MKEELQARLGERVARQRLARGYTQEVLAERCGYGVKFISTVERGLVNLPVVTLAIIARALGVTVSELTLGIDGALPREVRTLEQLLAGKSRKQQAALGRVLTAMNEMLAETPEKTD